MFKTLRGLILVLALSLTVAAPAFGQSAGDDQYVDPFQQEAGDGNGNNSNGNQGDTTQSQSQTDTTTPTTGDTAVAGQADTDTTDDGATLPHTGLPLAGLVLSGAALLASGTALRRRV
jgi:hypothetical protein